MALPENAHRLLKPGEKYVPVVSDSRGWKQISPYSIIFGFLMTILFTGASAFLGVKIAQVPEASMSVALIAMAVSRILKRQKALLENVMVQSIASVSTGVGAGAVFVLPAIYILKLEMATFLEMFIICACGSILAILFTIMVRRYYVADQHGVYPFPEATVAAETLAAGESTGGEMKLIGAGLLFGGIADMLNYYFCAWKGVFSTSFLPFFDKIADKAKLVLNYDTSAAVLGMGYVVGLRFSLIICGSCLVGYWIFVPCFAFLHDILLPLIPESILKEGSVLAMDPDEIFKFYVRPIGIGTFFTAGLVSIILSAKMIIKSIGQSFGRVSVKGDKPAENARDLRPIMIIGLLVVTLLGTFGFFLIDLLNYEVLIALLIFFVALALLIVFTPAAIMATVMMGNAPVSGMTIVCLVASSLILAATGFTGKAGMLVATLFGTFMCTSLAFSSSFVTDLKIGYWLGSTPAKQEGMKIIASLVAIVVVIFSIIIINDQYGFIKSTQHPNPMPAVQANAMANIINTFLGGGQAPWFFYGFGAALALLMRFAFGISPLAVALGLYIPIEYNIPLLAGALIAHFAAKKQGNETDGSKAKGRYDRGLLLSTGFVAAGSIAGILSATLNYFGANISKLYPAPANFAWANYISLAVAVIMIVFLWKKLQDKKDKGGTQ